jgi:phosphoribosylanthranilate isomerase
MTRVKICGITNIEDALHAAGQGADALGFVFYPGSPRYVEPEAAREIIAQLPPFVVAVGLFVNASPQRVREIHDFCALDRVQLHGDEDPRLVPLPPRQVIKAVRVRGEESLHDPGFWADHPLLFDAWSDRGFGGTGQTFDWQLAAALAEKYRIILAGGLTPDNVAAAIAAVHPYGVDVASGVERSPGIKDKDKVAAFIAVAKGREHV